MSVSPTTVVRGRSVQYVAIRITATSTMIRRVLTRISVWARMVILCTTRNLVATEMVEVTEAEVEAVVNRDKVEEHLHLPPTRSRGLPKELVKPATTL